MKRPTLLRIFAIILITGLFQLNTLAQDTIVQWTFPTEDGTADGGVIQSNLTRTIETAGGTSNIQFKNGATTKAAQATGWDNGNDEKKWKVEFETTGYGNLKLSSKISSGGQNPGPRDFKVQYKLDDGSWTDVENSNFQTANDWTTGVLFELDLPGICDNQVLIKIRWIMTSDTASDGSVVTETGISKIDDIFITGQILNGDDEVEAALGIKTYPNPASDVIQIESVSHLQVELYDMNGKRIQTREINTRGKIEVSALNPGIYLLKMKDLETNSVTSTTIVKQ
ncbi:MAG: T9SS type A sorting domain-containing protein [Bacteroidales bacterium]|jgi:hypothetical protein|nr:T9SS type A sorting domain-containing protein [Bacteroidales bacterium]